MSGRHDTPDQWRWPRLLAIAVAAVVLASCRSLTPPLVTPLAAVVATAPEAAIESAASAGESATASAPAPASVSVAAAFESPATHAAATTIDHAVRPAGCEAAGPPLPRHLHRPGPSACRDCGPVRAGCPTGACGSCQPMACVPLVRPLPMAGPCLVCDGGDAHAPARPVAATGLANLTAGDTVARYRIDDEDADACDTFITASNCACVYAPRFGSVRQVTRPSEDSRPIGPRGLAVDTSTEAQVDLVPVCRSTQSLALISARKALPGVAVEERLGPLALDQGGMPHEADGRVQAVEDAADEILERAELVQTPRMAVGLDVPLAWTCARGVMVTLGRQQAEVVAADRGTATVRLATPGRAELTLCKRAGSDTARVGEELDFMIYLHNSGDRPLADITLADALPARLQYVPDSAAANHPAEFVTETGDDGSVVLKWQFRHTFRPGEGGFVRFRTIVR